MRIKTLRMLLMLVAIHNWEADQMVIVGVYLNTTLPEEEVVYMDPIPGLEDSSGWVLRVIKSLYGLKQAGHVWNNKINSFLIE